MPEQSNNHVDHAQSEMVSDQKTMQTVRPCNEQPISEISEPIQGKQAAKPGRPSKFSQETVSRLLEAISDGLNIKQACTAAAIGETTLSRWKSEYPDLEIQLNEAREKARQDALRSIQKAGNLDWRAKARWLELSFHADYRQAGTKIELNNQQAQEAVKVLITPDQRRAMIKAREELLMGGPKNPPLPEQRKLLPGHIGATRGPGDEEQSDTEQTIVQPGQAFTPYFEPHGVDVAAHEAELSGWIVKK